MDLLERRSEDGPDDIFAPREHRDRADKDSVAHRRTLRCATKTTSATGAPSTTCAR